MPGMLTRCFGSIAVFLVLAAPARGANLDVQPGDGIVTVSTGVYSWVLSTNTFDVIHAASVKGQQRLGPGRATITALGKTLVFGPPVEVRMRADWVEFRGWADLKSNLWYVAHYQFFSGRPFVRLVFTVTDRHDKSPALEPWEPYWKNRVLSNWRLEIGAPAGKPAGVTQYNSYSFGVPGAPWVEVAGVTGAPYQWAPHFPPLDPSRFQLFHSAKDGANQVVWHPMYEGKADVTALITGLTGANAYRAAKAVTYEVVDAAGQSHSKQVSQTTDTIKLGTFTLGKDSTVRLKATGGGGEELAIAGPLKIAPTNGDRAFEIKLGARHDGILSEGAVSVVVKDFWQHHPISLLRTDSMIGWEAIKTPEQYTGGMGLTIETMIAMDGAPVEASAALYAPPRRVLPSEVRPADGSTAQGAVAGRYDALLRLFAKRMPEMLETMDNFGWRNWGDYQIGVSFTTERGAFEDWANLQYDLPGGLMLAWIRTGDPALWHFAQASVRHLMDMDLVKFYPFKDKLNGLVYRKGEMARARSHVDAEPITDQGFAYRSLLLYYRLTGEEWAADLAKHNIDRLVYYAAPGSRFVLNGDRPTAWMLRSALAGAENFPRDSTHNYQATADSIVDQLVQYYKANKHLPGAQPVWQGQMVEGLAEFHRRTGRADVAEVIVGHMRHLLSDCTRALPDGRYEFTYCHTPGGGDCAVAQWTDGDNYLFLWLSGIAYAYKLSNDPFFKKWADTLFAYGEAKMRDHADIRPWTSLLAYPHLFLELSDVRR
jgi:hypothetical protein